jgi:hypothetical protein
MVPGDELDDYDLEHLGAGIPDFVGEPPAPQAREIDPEKEAARKARAARAGGKSKERRDPSEDYVDAETGEPLVRDGERIVAVNGVSVTSHKQGFTALRHYGEAEVQLKGLDGESRFTRGKFVGKTGPVREEDWDENTQEWVSKLETAAIVYARAKWADADAGEIATMDVDVPHEYESKTGNVFTRWRKEKARLMGKERSEKLEELQWSHEGHTYHGAEAAEVMKEWAQGVYQETVSQIWNHIKDIINNPETPPNTSERMYKQLIRLKHIADLNPEAFSNVVRTGDPQIDKFYAVIALLVYAGLSRMGHTVSRYEPGGGRPKHTDPINTRPGLSSEIMFEPEDEGMPESRQYALESLFFTLLENKGAAEALEFSKVAFQNPSDLLKRTASGTRVMLCGFSENEDFLNGLPAQVVQMESGERPLIVRLEDTPKTADISEDSKLLRVAMHEVIVFEAKYVDDEVATLSESIPSRATIFSSIERTPSTPEEIAKVIEDTDN